MPTLSFEGETHEEIVRQVRAWLASADARRDGRGQPAASGMVDTVDRAADMTKGALTVLAQAAPGPLSESDVVKGLTRLGYEVTDSTRRVVTATLDALSDPPGDAHDDRQALLKRIERGRNAAFYEMSSAVARQILRTFGG